MMAVAVAVMMVMACLKLTVIGIRNNSILSKKEFSLLSVFLTKRARLADQIFRQLRFQWTMSGSVDHDPN